MTQKLVIDPVGPRKVRQNSTRILGRRIKVPVARHEGIVMEGVATEGAATGASTTERTVTEEEE